jgi:hypothetical protein
MQPAKEDDFPLSPEQSASVRHSRRETNKQTTQRIEELKSSLSLSLSLSVRVCRQAGETEGVTSVQM